MTIPGLITKHKANKLRTQLLRANAIIQQAAMRMKADELNIDEIVNKRDYKTIQSYFKNGGCKLPTSGATAKYKNYSGELDTNHAAASQLLHPYCLFDGMVLWIGIINTSNEGEWEKTNNSLLAIDINGWGNKPDRYGHDIFFWAYNPDTQMLVPIGDNDYFKAGNSRIAYNHTNTGSAVWWWCRSPHYYATNYFRCVWTDGYGSNGNAYYSAGVRPGFSV